MPKRGAICRYHARDRTAPAFAAFRYPGPKGNCAIAFFADTMEEAVALVEKYDQVNELELRYSRGGCEEEQE